ncbi:MAG TPA: LamG domain-containing protein [Pyrinomonadaceae bacterium]|jgi:hypothetical protein
MKKVSVLLTIVVLLFNAAAGRAREKQPPKRSVTWKIDNLEKIGGNKIEVLGAPQIIKTGRGKALWFDGVDDGVFINRNPLEGFHEFTVEAVFRPDAGGAREQRWLHIEDTQNAESRTLLETRLVGDEWFLDTFLKSGDNRSALYAENFKHPLGKWYAVALVFDGNEMRHYVDGKLELSGKITRKAFGGGVTSIGVRQNKIYWFKGAVLKARFTNRALKPGDFIK